MATDASTDSLQDELSTHAGARTANNLIRPTHEHREAGFGLGVLRAAAVNRSYDSITVREGSNAIIGDVYGGVHYHIRPTHAIAQLPGQSESAQCFASSS